MDVWFKNSAFDKLYITKTMKQVIDEVKMGNYRIIVENIRLEQDIEKQKTIKLQLPIFYPAGIKCEEFVQTTGVVQFDIDVKSNYGLNIQDLKEAISGIDQCMYAYISPRNGLKFGIKTDFVTNSVDSDIKEQFKLAYDYTEKFVINSLNNFIDVTMDTSMRSIQAGSFLSYDDKCYFNPDCSELLVLEYCKYIKSKKNMNNSTQYFDEDFIKVVLSNIPADFSYQQRFPINCSVLFMLGKSGIEILLDHWQKADRDKLRKQLEEQLKRVKYGDIGTLINCAREYGYMPTTGKSRKKLMPKLGLENNFIQPYSVESGQVEISHTISDFFISKHSVLLKSSVGAGKTNTVIDYIINELDPHFKVLLLVPAHKLGQEIQKKFNDKFDKPKHARCVYGMKNLCLKQDLLEKFMKHDANIPWQHCAKECGMRQECKYLEQYMGLENETVLIMAHNEWSNEQSIWFKGIESSIEDGVSVFKPTKQKVWSPDYVVIEENIFQVKDIASKETGKNFESIRNVIAELLKGRTLADAIIEQRQLVISDHCGNNKSDNYRYVSIDDSLNVLSNSIATKYSEILERCAKFLFSNDPEYLRGICFDENSLKLHKVTVPNYRYKLVPTLFLDATASEDVLREIYPSLLVENVPIKFNSDVRIHQLCNSTISKNILEDDTKYRRIVYGLKAHMAKYSDKTFGIITYKSIKGNQCFSESIADELGIKIISNFGNTRGLNLFENVDVLYVLGRNRLPDVTVQIMANTLFGTNPNEEVNKGYSDQLILMNDGTVSSVNSSTYFNQQHNFIHLHYGISETIQAIGRSRPIHGNEKDVYVFTNESMGSDIEVTDFFTWDDFFASESYLTNEMLNKVNDLDVIYLKIGNLSKLFNIKTKIIQRNYEKVVQDLMGAGMWIVECAGKYQNGTKWRRKFAIRCEEALRRHIEKNGEKFISIVSTT